MLSKLSPVCASCPLKDTCDHKRMIGYGELAMPITTSSSSDVTQPILRETMTIMVNGAPTIVYKDDIEKSIYKELYKHLNLQYGM